MYTFMKMSSLLAISKGEHAVVADKASLFGNDGSLARDSNVPWNHDDGHINTNKRIVHANHEELGSDEHEVEVSMENMSQKDGNFIKWM